MKINEKNINKIFLKSNIHISIKENNSIIA